MAVLGEPYDLIVSLGDWCGPAANIRRCFGVTRAMPFDWWVSPYSSTVKMLEEEFANLLRPENLEVLAIAGVERASVRCRHYGHLHHHDFARDEDERVRPDILPQVANAAEKTRFIVRRFFETIVGKRILFIRDRLDGDLWYERIWYGADAAYMPPCSEEELVRAATLQSLLQRFVTPGQADLLVLSDNIAPGTTMSLMGGTILFERLGERVGNGFFWEENYDLLFERLGIELRGTTRMPAFRHQVGSLVTNGGRSFVRTEPGETGFALFGPYHKYSSGSYTAAFEIMPDPASSKDARACGWAEVCGGYGARVFAMQELIPEHLVSGNGRLILQFLLPEAAELEFRVYANGVSGLTVAANVAIAPLSETGGAS